MFKAPFKYALIAMTALSSLAFCDAKEENQIEKDPIFQTIASIEKPYRLLVSKDPSGLSVEMDDGCIWTIVGGASANVVRYWRINDPLVIYPCFSPSLQGSRFYLYNERVRDYAYAELSHGPLLGTPTNLQLVYINYTQGEIQLQDGAGRIYNYFIDKGHQNILNHWKINQSILIGSNETWHSNWFSNYPYVLINVERNEFLSAFFYSN